MLLCKTSNAVKGENWQTARIQLPNTAISIPVIGIENKNTNCEQKFNQHPLTKWSSFLLASFYAAHAHSHLQLQQNACKADWIQSRIFSLYTPRDMLM